jgi:hypothetical protein
LGRGEEEENEEIVYMNLTPSVLPSCTRFLLARIFSGCFTNNINIIQTERDKFMESLSFCRK